jgi:hypothetical protein
MVFVSINWHAFYLQYGYYDIVLIIQLWRAEATQFVLMQTCKPKCEVIQDSILQAMALFL